MMFKLMEYDYLSDKQHKLIESFESQYNKYGRLSNRQCEILEDIFNKAASDVEWSRPDSPPRAWSKDWR